MSFLAELSDALEAQRAAAAEDLAAHEAAVEADHPARVAVHLRGGNLRYALSLELLAAGELTVAELVRRIEATGDRIAGRASKSVSDALRWEIAHGRVVRVGRGRYRTGHIPRSTVRWMRQSLEQLRAWWRPAMADEPARPARTGRWAATPERPSARAILHRQARRQRDRDARKAADRLDAEARALRATRATHTTSPWLHPAPLLA